MENRSINADAKIEIRAGEDGKATISGYAAVFNSPSRDMGFVEIIRPNAFKRSLSESPDVFARFQHEGGLSTLGRTKAGTLKLWTDKIGLRYQINPPDTQAGRDAVELIRRGDISASSFAFSIPSSSGEKWDFSTTPPTRELLDIDLHDVAPVDVGAYAAASVQCRGLVDEARKTHERYARLEKIKATMKEQTK